MSNLILALATVAVSTASSTHVVEMGTRVTSNQEHPGVLYIVPWQAPDGPDVLYQDISSRIDNLVEPLDRDSFRRELDRRQQFERLDADNAKLLWQNDACITSAVTRLEDLIHTNRSYWT